MEKEDTRFQTLEQLHERRKQVVRLHRKGYGLMQIGGLSGLSYPTARGVIDRFKKAYEQRPKAVQAWLDEHYPEIEVRAKAEGAEIHRGDERPWSIPMCAVAAMRRPARRR